MKQISKQTVDRALRGRADYKAFRSEFLKRMALFSEFPQAVDVSVSGVFVFSLEYIEYEEQKALTLHIPVSIRIVIAKHLQKNIEVFDTMWDSIVNEVKKGLDSYDYPHWWKLMAVSLAAGDSWFAYISELIAWNDSEVGVWHVEQECGEGWIRLHRNWKNGRPKTVLTAIDNELPDCD